MSRLTLLGIASAGFSVERLAILYVIHPGWRLTDYHIRSNLYHRCFRGHLYPGGSGPVTAKCPDEPEAPHEREPIGDCGWPTWYGVC